MTECCTCTEKPWDRLGLPQRLRSRGNDPFLFRLRGQRVLRFDLADSALVERGKRIYMMACASCHALRSKANLIGREVAQWLTVPAIASLMARPWHKRQTHHNWSLVLLGQRICWQIERGKVIPSHLCRVAVALRTSLRLPTKQPGAEHGASKRAQHDRTAVPDGDKRQ